MDLNHDLHMTEELRAELATRRDAVKEAARRTRIRNALPNEGLVVPTSHSHRPFTTLRVDLVRRRASMLPSAFKRKVNAAMDVITSRAEALLELALDADLIIIPDTEDTEQLIATMISGTPLHFLTGSAEASTLQRAGDRIVEAFNEIDERVQLEVLRNDEDADLNWFQRRAARRDAAERLIEELGLFLEALSELPELTSVELAAEELLQTQRDAEAEVSQVAAS